MSVPSSRPSQADAAVIDVGSNSVRLVLYQVEGRAIWTVFNEKVLAGLGRDLASTNRLAPEGVSAALTALTRFRALLDASRPSRIFVAATAAVREAKDGPEFCRRVADKTGLVMRILSGEEEARYGALGVIAGAPDSRGLVGDLGGASLELVKLSGGQPNGGVTLPLGPFAFGEPGRFDAGRVRAVANRLLEPIVATHTSDTLTAVGGAWRNFALLHMRTSDYPLRIIHQYEIGRREALSAARFIAKLSRTSLESIPGVSRRRLESLPHAAIVLETLVEQLDIERVVMSAYGLREGLLFETLNAEIRARDPLAEGCADLGGRRALAHSLGAALEQWLGPAFARLEPVFASRDATLLAAACRLADLGAHLHPDHRAELVFDQVLRAPIAGQTHAERVFLACTAFARHTASAATPEPLLVNRLLSPERQQRARAIGAAIRLACDLSGRSPELLAHAKIDVRTNTVVLQAEEAWAATLLGEQTAKRAATLATALERDLKIRSMSAPSATEPPAARADLIQAGSEADA
jgi:exopolyphosphatase/guanosine-5'-triphosphate,3'-diphosphate pyrophosphatase